MKNNLGNSPKTCEKATLGKALKLSLGKILKPPSWKNLKTLLKKKWKRALIVLMIAGICLTPFEKQVSRLMSGPKTPLVIVIDAGHGGQDGGATGSDGTKESDIALSIAEEMRREAEMRGISVVMTREGEEGLTENGGTWSKRGDMKKRKEIIDEAGADLVISVHLNSFRQDSGVKGAQVFFPKEARVELREKNKKIAEAVQGSLNDEVNTEKKRIALEKGDIFLFRDPKELMLLVECGFLSNPEDLENLKDRGYRRKIGKTVMDSIWDFFYPDEKRNKK